MTRELTAEWLRACVHYDPLTGVFTWIAKPTKFSNIKVGDVAGGPDGGGYLRFRFAGRKYKAHRLAWLYVHGRWPEFEIDHENGIGTDNRIDNLRDVTHLVNAQNVRTARCDSSTDLIGVSPAKGGFSARIQVDGARLWLGTFESLASAGDVHLSAKRALHVGCTI